MYSRAALPAVNVYLNLCIMVFNRGRVSETNNLILLTVIAYNLPPKRFVFNYKKGCLMK